MDLRSIEINPIECSQFTDTCLSFEENIAKGTTDPGVDCFGQKFWFGKKRQVPLLPQYSHQTRQSPKVYSLAWSAAEWLRFFASPRVLFFTVERVQISGLQIIWQLSC